MHTLWSSLAAALIAVSALPAIAAEPDAERALASERAAAERPLRQARSAYPTYFARAYQRFPALPRGLLEAIAYTETNWIHVRPQAGEPAHERHMPASYGVMGLYRGEGFANQVAQAAKLLGVSERLIVEDPETNVLAAAALLDQARRAQAASGAGRASAPGIEAMAPVLAHYAGYADGIGRIDSYARQSFAYVVLQTLARGVRENGVLVPKQPVAMDRAFTPAQLRLLRAAALRMDGAQDRIEVDPQATVAPAHEAGAQAVDYGGAIWNPAYSGNYSTASNAMSAVIMHTVEGTYAGAISWFKNASANVSAHYVIRKSDGQITQMVREYHQAWHAKYHNGYTIGIEHDGRAADPGNWSSAMVNASAALTRSICARRGVNCASAWQGPGYDSWYLVPDSVRIKGHGMLTNNQNRYDPGKYFPWSSYYGLINGGSPPPSTTYWVDTFADATGYKWPSTLTPVGTLYKGTHYVYCKAWGQRVGSDTQYNHYWLKTDLDVGPANAWVSAYYLSRWGNDEARDNSGRVIPDC